MARQRTFSNPAPPTGPGEILIGSDVPATAANFYKVTGLLAKPGKKLAAGKAVPTPPKTLAAAKEALEPFRAQIVAASKARQTAAVAAYRVRLEECGFDLQKAYPYPSGGFGGFAALAATWVFHDVRRFVVCEKNARPYNAPEPCRMKPAGAIATLIRSKAAKEAAELLDTYAAKLAAKQASLGGVVAWAEYNGSLWEDSFMRFKVRRGLRGSVFDCWRTKVIMNNRYGKPYEQFPTTLQYKSGT